MSEAMERRFSELSTLAAAFAEAKSTRIYLDEFKKSKLAMLMKKYEGEGVKSNAAQETSARQDPEYIQLLSDLQIAVCEEEKAKWELRLVEMRFDYWRTQESTKRAEMNLR